MCTVSLISASAGTYFLGGNRDEQKSRKKGLPPTLKTANGVTYLAPEDAAAGGTWIAVNEFGLSLAILNRYQGNYADQKLPENPPSRGFIIPSLIHNIDLKQVEAQINEEFQAAQFRPFTLLAIGNHEIKALRWDWDGRNFIKSKPATPPKLWVSSGLYQEKVEESRNRVFQKFLQENSAVSASYLKKLHASTKPEPGHLAIAMELEHVQTVSCTIVEVGNDEILMHYHGGLPSLNRNWNVVKLKRRN